MPAGWVRRRVPRNSCESYEQFLDTHIDAVVADAMLLDISGDQSLSKRNSWPGAKEPLRWKMDREPFALRCISLGDQKITDLTKKQTGTEL